MNYRSLGKTGMNVSAVSLGCWSVSGVWGRVTEREFLAALHRAVELGVNFFDTADVYGKSEQLVGKFRQQTKAPIFIATKVGRRLDPHTASGYSRANLTRFVEDSLRKLDMEALDLVQLHCPPFEVYYMPEVFEAMDHLVHQGKVRHYGVSVEKVEEAIKAMEYPGVATIQIVFNMFRQRPAELMFKLAKRKGVGIIARLPLASGLLAGKFSPHTVFPPSDHRSFNRGGAAWDRGETLAGVGWDAGLQAVEELKEVCPPGMTMAQFALRWILMFPEVSCTIPGAKRPAQVEENAQAADLPPLGPATMKAMKAIYNRRIRPDVHHRW